MKKILPDILGLAGVALVGVGLWQVYSPASYIAGGLLLVYLGVQGAKRWA